MSAVTSARETAPARESPWMGALSSAVRTAFGVIWAINAWLTWRPSFAAHYVGYLQNAAVHQPEWLAPWFKLWLRVVTPLAPVFIWGTRIVETAIALALLLGFARRITYVVGFVVSLLIWATADGFGGPYVFGASNVGPALIYALVFVGLYALDHAQGREPYSVDDYLEQRWPRWRRVAESASADVLARPVARLSWRRQAAIIVAVVAVLIVTFGTLQSVLAVRPPTPANAAAAVSPLSLAPPNVPIAESRDATLGPVAPGDSVPVTIESTDRAVTIANGVQYNAWTFGGTVPGPVLHVRQGQTVQVTFVNHGNMQHSIDFHAAEVAPDIAYRSINPNESLSFSFVARTPGAFVYHCGTPPVLFHIANGMYGAIIVDPTTPLPPADRSYVLVQSEWYTSQVKGTRMGPNGEKMAAAMPDEVVFNGIAFQYRDHPLPAKVGRTVRLYVVNAGPNLPSAFHVIGGMFAAVYPDGTAENALHGVSTYSIAPGAGAVIDFVPQQPGSFAMVDHSMRSMSIGAAGLIHAEP